MERRFSKFYKKPLKYGNKTCVCRQDHRHDSIKEAQYCDQLELMKKSGEIQDYELQVTFDLIVDGYKVCAHRVDFLVRNKNGISEVHEVKGFATQLWNIKRKLFEALNPEIKYIVIT